MMKMLSAAVVVLLVIVSQVDCGRILAVFPVPIKNHVQMVDPMLERLARLGHEVTVITPFPRRRAEVPRFTEVEISDIVPQLEINALELRKIPLYQQLLYMMPTLTNMSQVINKHPKIQSIIRSKTMKFDLILCDTWMTYSLMGGFSHKFKAPIIAVSPTYPNIFSNYLVANPSPISYVPELMTRNTDHMSLCERVKNWITHILMTVMFNYNYLPAQDKLMREHFGADYPQLDQILKKTSMVFVNQDVSLSYVKPNQPNVVQVGGIHLRRPMLIPLVAQQYLDDSNQGAIVFDLGAHANTSKMCQDKINIFKKAFSRTKLNVLWRSDLEKIEGLPENVELFQFLPLNEILAHYNVKLLITNGGLFATIEAIARKKPFVAIPITGEDHDNVINAVNSGYAVSLDFENLTPEGIENAINEVLTNKTYKENISVRSEILTDTPKPVRDIGVFWVEYVMRHKGAYHMRSAGQDLSFIQLHSIDVYSFLVVTLAFCFYLSYKMFTGTYKFLKSKKDGSHSVKMTKKNN